MLDSFGIELPKLLVQCLLFLPLPIWATLRVASQRAGVSALFWLLAVWFLPVAGPLLALACVRGSDPRPAVVSR